MLKGRMESRSCPRFVPKITTNVCTNELQGMVDLIREDADKGFEDLEFIDEGDALERLDLM